MTACVDSNYDKEYWNDNAKLSLAITQKQLTSENAHYLLHLPSFAVAEGIRIVHGVPPDDFEEYSHRISENKLFRQLKKIPESISFVGHSHHLSHRTFDSKGRRTEEYILLNTPYTVDPDLRTIVNVGSVGQPDRDHVGDLGAK